MASEVEQMPRLVKAAYAWHRSQWVNYGVTHIIAFFAWAN